MTSSDMNQSTTETSNAPITSHPSSDTTPHLRVGRDEGSRMIPEGGGHPSDTAPPMEQATVGCRKGIISSAALLEQCKASLRDPMTQIWGFHVRPSTVTLFIGETSVGKTVFLHNLAYHLASGKEFLGNEPPRLMRVLYVDIESNEEVLGEHLSTIGVADGWDFFDLQDVTPGQVLMEQLKTVVNDGHYDVVIIDPLMEAYPVKDENDNAMANTQMSAFRDLARSSKAGVIVVHNSGLRKSSRGSKKFLGRGATSRVDRADISINLTSISETERLLQVTKARSKNLNEEIRFRFGEDLSYDLLESSTPSQTVVASLQHDTFELVKSEAQEGRPEVERKTFMEKLNIEKGSGREQALDRALSKNFLTGVLAKPRKGVYSLPLDSLKVESEAA